MAKMMWMWTCSIDPNYIHVTHSYEEMDRQLTSHENGVNIQEIPEIPPCEQNHNYWEEPNPVGLLLEKARQLI